MAVGENLLKGGREKLVNNIYGNVETEMKNFVQIVVNISQVQLINSGLTGDAVNKFIGAVNKSQ